MKKILFISLLTLSAGTFAACNDWLSIPSPTQLDNETVFENIDAAEMAVLGVYNSSFSETFFYEFGTNSDEAIANEDGVNSRTRMANYEYLLPDITENGYKAMYTAIERANSIIKQLAGYEPSGNAEQKKKNMLLGECYALRAQSYLHLVRLYGDVPYTDKPFEDAASFNLGRTSRDVIYDACVADLQQAIELLPWFSEGAIPTPERFSKNAAYGLLARVALYAAGYSLRWDLETYAESSLKIAKRSDAARVRELYQIASDACAAVIAKGENALLPKFETVFKDIINDRYNNESMLEFGQLGDNNNFNPARIGYTNGMAAIRNNTIEGLGRCYPMQRGMPTLWFDYEHGDTRRNVTIANHGIDINGGRVLQPYSAQTMGKFRGTWRTTARPSDDRRSINWISLRYSDVLLMYAEAQNELNNGPTSQAIDALKQVRTRAFGGNASLIGTIPSDYQGFLDAIIEERKLELAFEGWRKTDLARWGILYETLMETKTKLHALIYREGEYADVPRFVAYKIERGQLGDPINEVEYVYTYMTEPNATEKAQIAAEGLTLVNMNGEASRCGLSAAFIFFFDTADVNKLNPWVDGQFLNGLQKNKSELYPFKQTIMDQNPGLKGQQLPGYMAAQ
jgi:hypothetical protein